MSDKMPAKTKSTNHKVSVEVKNTNSSSELHSFILRPQALKDNSKSGEGPTINTDIYDIFSLFPINEANI